MGRVAGRGDAAARVGFGVNLGSLSVFLELLVLAGARPQYSERVFHAFSP